MDLLTPLMVVELVQEHPTSSQVEKASIPLLQIVVPNQPPLVSPFLIHFHFHSQSTKDYCSFLCSIDA